MPAVLKMDGVRSWLFTPNDNAIQPVGMQETDFCIQYGAQTDGSKSNLTLDLAFAWEHSDLSLKGRAQRSYIEDRMKLLQWTYVGQKGTLLIDDGTAEERTVADITLMAVNPSMNDNNGLLEYTLSFAFPEIGSGGTVKFARGLQFGADADPLRIISTAENFVIIETREDRTVFKDLFRASPVRVPNGPSLINVKITGIIEETASKDLAGRKGAEAVIATWAAFIGQAKELKLLAPEASSLGVHHLRSVQPGSLELPDSFTFDLEFVRGYSE